MMVIRCALGTKGREGMGKNGDWTEEGSCDAGAQWRAQQPYREIHTGGLLQSCAKLSSRELPLLNTVCAEEATSLAKAILAWTGKEDFCGLACFGGK